MGKRRGDRGRKIRNISTVQGADAADGDEALDEFFVGELYGFFE